MDTRYVAALGAGGLRRALLVNTLGGMCRRVTCKQCDKPNWAGCGAHVEMVLGDVPKADRCRCRETGAPKVAAGSAPEAAGAVGRFKSWLSR